MLSLLILWVVLGAGTYLLGLHLVHFFDREHLLDRLGDRAIISLTLGCLTLAVLLSVFVLFGPLNAVPGVLILAVAAAGVAARPAVRREAMSTARLVLQPRFALPVTLVTLGVALAASDPVGWYDSGLYHYPFVKWMREYGMIPGVALVHDAFGQSSIWYPMTAFLSDGSLRDRVGGVWAGFLFVAACSYLLLALLRIADGRARHADWYVAVVIPLSVQPFL
ncbi:MAG TPA: hypothetical protein VHM67_12075, partial [Gemmatimonadaceae bacterium]|nr:hypothetical protein [Gemmatimonadaceae bacterium]